MATFEHLKRLPLSVAESGRSPQDEVVENNVPPVEGFYQRKEGGNRFSGIPGVFKGAVRGSNEPDLA